MRNAILPEIKSICLRAQHTALNSIIESVGGPSPFTRIAARAGVTEISVRNWAKENGTILMTAEAAVAMENCRWVKRLRGKNKCQTDFNLSWNRGDFRPDLFESKEDFNKRENNYKNS